MTSEMEYVLQISNRAYEQEVNRGQFIFSKADYLVKWVTLFISVFNIAIPIIVKEMQFDYKNCTFILLYIVLMLALITAMISLVLVSFPKKIKRYPLGYEILKKEKVKNEENWDLEVIYQNILMQDKITEKLKKSHDKMIINIMIANISIVIAVIFLAVIFIYLVNCV